MSTAVPQPDYTVYLQGSGRVDAARATAQTVFATGKADFRILDAAAPVRSETITYSNTGDQDVTLDLTTDIKNSGSTAEPGMFTLSASSVTVPAGGTVDVELTLDPSLGATGRYSGEVRATSGSDIAVTTAVGFVQEAPSANLTVRVFDRNGEMPQAATIFVQDVHDATRYFQRHGAGHTHETTIRLPLGDYSLQGSLDSRDPGGTGLYYASDMFALPNVSVTGDTTVTIDARQAQDLEMNVAEENRPLDGVRLNQGIYRMSEYGGSGYAVESNLSRTNTRYGAIPSEAAEVGDLFYSPYLTQREPLLQARIVKPIQSSVEIAPAEDSARFTGSRRLAMVDVGAGLPEDYDGLDVRGKAVLVQSSSSSSALIQSAIDQGAAAVVFAQQAPGVFIVTAPSDTTVPVMTVDYDEGRRLTGLLGDGPVELALTGVKESRYGYPLRLNQLTGIPDDLSMDVSRRDLVRVENDFHSDVPDRMGGEFMYSFAPWDTLTGGEVIDLLQPVRRVDYVVPGTDLRYKHTVWAGSSSDVDVTNALGARFTVGDDVRTSWHKQPYRPSEDALEACNFCRSARALSFAARPNGDAELGHWGSNRAQVTRAMYRDGQLVSDPGELLVDGPATYRIVDHMQRSDAPGVTYARESWTEWTFSSQAPTEREVPGCEDVLDGATTCSALPVFLPRYDLPLDLHNRAPAGRSFGFTAYADRAIGYQGPAPTGVKVFASFDDGATWQAATRQPGHPHDDGYRFRIKHPKLAATDGFVWLRMWAWDDAGNRVEHTVKRAYGLH